MLLHFTKMHGLGNDFMVVDLVTQRARLRDEQIRQLADRRFGIGFDQLLIVEPPRDPDMDFRYRIYNADGSEVENCGNGARCFARFVRDQRLTHKHEIHVETAGGPLVLNVQHDGMVRVDMGRPRFNPATLPFEAPGDQPLHEIDVGGETLQLGVVSMGNPHAVAFIESDVADYPLRDIGPMVESHALFPNKVNFEIVNVLSRDRLKVRVWERGSGLTQACGTGACAVVVAARLKGLVEEVVTIDLPGGSLSIQWPGSGDVIMEGPVAEVFDGDWLE